MSLSDRITQYLSVGGLWNPELMEHDKVRDLLIECRSAFTAQQEQLDVLRRIADRGLLDAGAQWVRSGFLSRDWNSQIDCWQHLLDELKRVQT